MTDKRWYFTIFKGEIPHDAVEYEEHIRQLTKTKEKKFAVIEIGNTYIVSKLRLIKWMLHDNIIGSTSYPHYIEHIISFHKFNKHRDEPTSQVLHQKL